MSIKLPELRSSFPQCFCGVASETPAAIFVFSAEFCRKNLIVSQPLHFKINKPMDLSETSDKNTALKLLRITLYKSNMEHSACQPKIVLECHGADSVHGPGKRWGNAEEDRKSGKRSELELALSLALPASVADQVRCNGSCTT